MELIRICAERLTEESPVSQRFGAIVHRRRRAVRVDVANLARLIPASRRAAHDLDQGLPVGLRLGQVKKIGAVAITGESGTGRSRAAPSRHAPAFPKP